MPDDTPAPLAEGRDPLGWAIAAAPLAASALTLSLALVIAEAATRFTSLLAIAATAALVVADKRRIAGSRCDKGPLPSTAWFLVPPVYLWKRASVLGFSRRLFWMNLVFVAAGLLLGILATVSIAGRQVEATQLPTCDDPAALNEVVAIFSDMPEARRAGVKGVSLGRPAEIRETAAPKGAPRFCTGSMLASDTHEYALDYSFEWRQGEIIVRIELQ